MATKKTKTKKTTAKGKKAKVRKLSKTLMKKAKGGSIPSRCASSGMSPINYCNNPCGSRFSSARPTSRPGGTQYASLNRPSGPSGSSGGSANRGRSGR